jgi:hypothetical protein
MKDERDIRIEASDCFNHYGYLHDGVTPDDSAYKRLSKLMMLEYDLDDYEVEELVHAIEQLVADYIIETSPKFTDNDS